MWIRADEVYIATSYIQRLFYRNASYSCLRENLVATPNSWALPRWMALEYSVLSHVWWWINWLRISIHRLGTALQEPLELLSHPNSRRRHIEEPRKIGVCHKELKFHDLSSTYTWEARKNPGSAFNFSSVNCGKYFYRFPFFLGWIRLTIFFSNDLKAPLSAWRDRSLAFRNRIFSNENFLLSFACFYFSI